LARIAGVDLPKNERIEIGLTRIFGIGRALSQKILSETKVTPNTRVKDLTDEEIVKIRTIIDRDFRVEGDLRRDISMGIKRLMDISCYRGTRTNARTRKGPRKVAVSRKKEA